jgi:hypothetical protein
MSSSFAKIPEEDDPEGGRVTPPLDDYDISGASSGAAVQMQKISYAPSGGTFNPIHDDHAKVDVKTVHDLHGDDHDVAKVDDSPLSGYELHLENLFHYRKRGTTIRNEVIVGAVQFISCLYVLPVVPEQLAKANYDTTGSIVATALTCAIGCFISAFITNTPFIIAPPTSVSIFLAVFLKQQSLSPHVGNVTVMLSGFLLIVMGLIRPIGAFITYVSLN